MERSGRKPRQHIPNSTHHVMTRGNNRQNIFYHAGCYEHYLKILCESTNKFDHEILAYCLMSNHVHLVIKINSAPLSDIMQNINYRFARWSNHHMKRIGHLFQGRFRSIEVCSEEYLINLVRYIHNNPVAANITNDLDHYEWSSHKHYTSQNSENWLDINVILRILKKKTGQSYKHFIKSDICRNTWKPAFYMNDDGELVIDDSLIDTSRTDINAPHRSKTYKTEEVEASVCKKLNVSKTEMIGPRRDWQLCKKRAMLAYCLLHYTDMNLAQIACYLQRTHATLRRQVNQLDNNKMHSFSDELFNNNT